MRRLLAGSLLALLSAAVPAVAGTIRFVEGGAAANARLVHHTRRFAGQYADVLGMFTSGGAAVAVGDYDNDGREDLFVTDSALQGKCHLLHNDGADRSGRVTFTDVASAAGVAGGNDALSIVTDALWFDADNDGLEDLLVVRFGAPILYRNLGNGRFRDISAVSGLTRFGNSIAAIAFDYDNDGRLDILLGNYFKPVNLLALGDRHVLPNNMDQAVNGGGVTLWHNEGPNARGGITFVETTAKAGFASHTGWTLDVGHGDFNNDGWQDVYLACDYGTDRMFLNHRRRHLRRRHREGDRHRHQEGDERRLRRLRQRRLARHLRHQHHRRVHEGMQHALAQQRRRRRRPAHLHRPLERDRHLLDAVGLGRQVRRTSTTTAGRTSSSSTACARRDRRTTSRCCSR